MLKIPTWDELFMGFAYEISYKSKDLKTRIGSVLVRDRRPFSFGFNGICEGVNDRINERNERPEKYLWTEHAERNSIFGAAKLGISCLDSILYTQGIACADCGRAIIQSGIKEIVVHEPWMNLFREVQPQWEESCGRTLIMFQEAKIKVVSITHKLGKKTLLNGTVYDV